MKKNHRILRGAAIALAGLLLGGALDAARAATITTTNGSIVLGFREASSSTAYLVDLGNFSTFQNATGTITLSLGNIGADLQATFGGNGTWYTRSDLFWGVFGTSNVSNPNLYASRERTNPSTPSAPWPNLSGSLTDRQNTATNVIAVSQTWLNGKTSTANSNFGTVQSGVSGQQSYYTQVATVGVTDFGSTSQWSSIEGSFANGAAGTVLDFFRVPNPNVSGGTPSSFGSFSINTSGQVSFTAIPEPSTYALMAFAGTVFLVFVRRRKALNS